MLTQLWAAFFVTDLNFSKLSLEVSSTDQSQSFLPLHLDGGVNRSHQWPLFTSLNPSLFCTGFSQKMYEQKAFCTP
ncbi:hypothetical protein [Nostoc sp. NMS4]|uniref:hypothetical protein n=1 Tax=Nostoc sp. NMS4 TaxID=2815390 RepID=UPI0025CE6752|nr:hypothetical protein [Nostoc sp. NMS4]